MIKYPRKFTNIQEKEICKQYIEEEISTVALAEKLNCGNMTISRIVRRNGFILRTQKEAVKLKKTREKMSKSHTGKILSETHKKNISKAFSGEKHPMYGKYHSVKAKEKMSRSHKGRKAWNKGLTKETDARVVKYAKKLKGNHPSEQTLRKLSESHKGIRPSEETRRKKREKALLYIQNHSGPFKDTKPELKMKEILNELNIPFEHQFRLGNHLYDFHIPNTNILIEVDGDYYHGNPKKFKKLNNFQQGQKQKDIKNNQLAKENNYILLRFWASNILNNTEGVKNKILKNIILI